MADWAVKLEQAPLGIGCMPKDASFPSRTEANYFSFGHVKRQHFGMRHREWTETGIKSAGCVRITAVPRRSVTRRLDRLVPGENATWATHEVTIEEPDQALEAFVTPIGAPLLPTGRLLELPVQSLETHEEVGHAAFEAVGDGLQRTHVAWGLGDLFGSSFAVLPSELSGEHRRPLDDGAHGLSKNYSNNERRSTVIGGELVTLVRPPPIRVFSARMVVGAPRAWAGTGRRGMLAIVDVIVDLLDRPVAINTLGMEVVINDTEALNSRQRDSVDVLRPQDLQERLMVSISSPVVLAAAGLPENTSVSLDNLPIPGRAAITMDHVLRPGSMLGASLVGLGPLPLPGERQRTPSVNTMQDAAGPAATVVTCSKHQRSNSSSAACEESTAAAVTRRHRAISVSSSSASSSYYTMAAGAPGAGLRREGGVLLLWLKGSPSLRLGRESRLRPAFSYGRAEPGTMLDSLPSIAAWRMLSVAP